MEHAFFFKEIKTDWWVDLANMEMYFIKNFRITKLGV